MRRPLAALALFGALCGVAVASRAAPPQSAVAPAAFTCAECGMRSDGTGRFIARLVVAGAASHFCDIGDLVAFLERARPREYAAAVRDVRSGEWLDVAAAVFVIDKKAYETPMGWGIAAFRDRSAAPAQALDFAGLRKAVR